MNIRLLFSICLFTGLTACQTAIRAPVVQYDNGKLLPNEELFSGEVTPLETPEQIFSLPPDVKQGLYSLINREADTKAQTLAVLKYIFSYADDGLLYDNTATRTASETLSYGKANCLSLSILAYALAKAAGMDAEFQQVHIPEYWTSGINQSWLNGHVNLRIRQKSNMHMAAGTILLGTDTVVDFDPYSSKQQFSTNSISAARIVAMFYNNKAAVAYADYNYAQAYAYYKAAITADPRFAATWSNLGVLYRYHQLLDLAEHAYLYSLRLDPRSTNTLSNLSLLYRLTDREAEASKLEHKVLAQRKNNPYYYLMLGNEALQRGDPQLAIDEFKHALTLEPNNHEVYFGLARSYLLLDNPTQASRYMKKALRSADANQDQRRYEHKLAILNQIAKAH